MMTVERRSNEDVANTKAGIVDWLVGQDLVPQKN